MIRTDMRVYGRPGPVVRVHQRVDHGQAPLPCPPAMNTRAKGSYDDVPLHAVLPKLFLPFWQPTLSRSGPGILAQR